MTSIILPSLALAASLGYGVLALYEPTKFRTGVRIAEAVSMAALGSLVWYGLSTL